MVTKGPVDKIQCLLDLAHGGNRPRHEQFAGLSVNLVRVLRREDAPGFRL